MGFFKKLLGDAADELKKSLEETKKEMRNNLEEMKQNAKAGFIDSVSKYARKLKDYEARLREIPGDKVSFYGGASERIPVEKTIECSDANAVKSNDDHPSEKETAFEFIHKLRDELVKAYGNKGNSTEAYSTFDRLKQQYNCARELYLNGERSAEKIKEAIQLNLDKDAGKSNNDSAFQITVKKENNDNGGFSSRMEALISASLQDGVLTDQEKAVLKKRAEKEGEDWDEVEMIIEARLAEMQPSIPKSNTETLVEQKVISEIKEKEELSDDEEATDGDEYIVGMPYSEKTSTIVNQESNDNIDGEGYYIQNGKRIIIPTSTKVIKEREFAEKENIEKVVFPSSIIKIESYAFVGCSHLIDIDFSKCQKLKEIGESAFLNCALRSVDLSRCTSLETIGELVFCGCRSLTNIVFPNSVTSIGGCAFGQNEKLSQIDLSSTNIKVLNDYFGTTREYYTFYGTASDMKNLKHISFPASIQEVPKMMCYKLEWLDSVDLSKCTQLKRICEAAFACTPNLKEVLLPDSIEVMEKWAFAECGNIKHIDMPASLKEMGYGVFAGSEIKSADFSKVTRLSTIPDATFGECNRLKDVILPSSLEEFGSGVFIGGSKLKNLDFSKVSSLEVIPERFLSSISIITLTIPNGVKEIEDDAFDVGYLEKMFLPPSLEHLGTFVHYDMNFYCFAPLLDELEPLIGGHSSNIKLYVLPQHLNAYMKKRDAEGVSRNILRILPMPDEYLYYYDN